MNYVWLWFTFPLQIRENKESQAIGVQREKENGIEIEKKGSTKSALTTFNSHNTAEDNDARSSGIKWRK